MELMITMTVLTIVLGLTVALMVMLLRVNVSSRDHAANENSIARLARAFRNDVRDSSRVSRCDEGASSGTIDFQHASNTHLIAYQVSKAGVTRVEWSGPDIVEQDWFRLPSRTSPRFTRKTIDGRCEVALMLDRHARKSTASGAVHTMTVEATLNASSRFLPKTEDAK